VTDTTTPPQEVQDLAGVRAMLSKLLADGRGDEMVAMVVGLMEKLLTKNSQLEWRLQAALRQLYRKRSEKVSPEQLALFLSQLEDSEAAKANVEVTPPAAPKTLLLLRTTRRSPRRSCARRASRFLRICRARCAR
jgi:hypothetical protein